MKLLQYFFYEAHAVPRREIVLKNHGMNGIPWFFKISGG